MQQYGEFKFNFKQSVNEGYSTALYKDVCKEYIKDLNDELKKVKTSMSQDIEAKKLTLNKRVLERQYNDVI